MKNRILELRFKKDQTPEAKQAQITTKEFEKRMNSIWKLVDSVAIRAGTLMVGYIILDTWRQSKIEESKKS